MKTNNVDEARSSTRRAVRAVVAIWRSPAPLLESLELLSDLALAYSDFEALRARRGISANRAQACEPGTDYRAGDAEVEP